MDEPLTLAFVVAHPDDDAYGVAGSVALHADDPRFRFVLVHATDGGAGDIREGCPPRARPSARSRQGRGGTAGPGPGAGSAPTVTVCQVLDQLSPGTWCTAGPAGGAGLRRISGAGSRTGQRPERLTTHRTPRLLRRPGQPRRHPVVERHSHHQRARSSRWQLLQGVLSPAPGRRQGVRTRLTQPPPGRSTRPTSDPSGARPELSARPGRDLFATSGFGAGP